MAHSNGFTLQLSLIQPSQLYICREKYLALSACEISSLLSIHSPLPVVQLENDIVFTDGHTRALVAYQAGMTQIPVIWDTDTLDIFAYFECVRWCKAEGIYTIMDLQERIIPFEAFQRLWIDRCQGLRR